MKLPAWRDVAHHSSLPWHVLEAQRARVQAQQDQAKAWERRAVAEVAHISRSSAARRVTGDESDSTLRDMAQRRADLMVDRISETREVVSLAWLNEQLAGLDAKPLPKFTEDRPTYEQLAAAVRRVSCPLWWRRQLRRAAVRARETRAMHAGEVCARTRQPYVTNDTLRRREAQQARNRDMLERTEIESQEGEIITLWQAVEASVSNKAIRRGELMTRIRGAEEWANARGMVGLFTTNTAPSRFHAQLFKGGANPEHIKAGRPDAKAAQQWLCKAWARTRAALHRRGVSMFGYRVAEPHHDGCPHWHMLLWCEPEKLDALRETMRFYWLAEELDEAEQQQRRWSCVGTGRRRDGQPIFINPCLLDGGLNLEAVEKGCTNYRVKFKDLEHGGAVGYVAKYISKGIDDAGAVADEGHKDEFAGEQGDMFGGQAKRVETWAAAWGIRQFQAIGQPPVTVWRELRRVSEPAAQGASQRVKLAREAVNKDGGRRACWRTYMEAQGGAMLGRGHAIRVATEDQHREGMYEARTVPVPVGVLDLARPDEWVLSDRKQWKPRGLWRDSDRTQLRGWNFEVRHESLLRNRGGMAAGDGSGAGMGVDRVCAGSGVRAAGGLARPQAAQPWTRVNNCTRAGGAAFLMQAGIVGAQAENPFSDPGAGGRTFKEDPPCPRNEPSPLSLRMSRWPSRPLMSSASR